MTKEKQEAIKQKCNDLCDVLLRKNNAYGNACGLSQMFSKVSPEEGLWIRLGDKVRRLENMRKVTGLDSQVPTETIADTLLDIAGYSILLLCEDASKSND